MSDGERREPAEPSERRREDASAPRLLRLTQQFADGVDHRLRRLERQLYARWAFTFLSIVVAALLFAHSQGTASRAASAAQKAVLIVQQGRQVSLSAICAAVNGISQAGQDVLDPPNQKETPFTRALERLGYPSLSQRRAQARIQGQLYAQEIAGRVDWELERSGHGPIRGLLRKDGTIDCGVLQRIAAVPHSR